MINLFVSGQQSINQTCLAWPFTLQLVQQWMQTDSFWKAVKTHSRSHLIRILFIFLSACRENSGPKYRERKISSSQIMNFSVRKYYQNPKLNYICWGRSFAEKWADLSISCPKIIPKALIKIVSWKQTDWTLRIQRYSEEQELHFDSLRKSGIEYQALKL